MCGRYVRRSDKQRIVDYFHTGATVFEIPPSYNIAPTSFQPVIRSDRDTGERELTMMRWGLIPSWKRLDPDPRLFRITSSCLVRDVTLG